MTTLALAAILASTPMETPLESSSPETIPGPSFAAWTKWDTEGDAYVRTLSPARPWTELVLSWNATLEPGARIDWYAEVPGAPQPYHLGTWAESAEQGRGSTNGQKDDFGQVYTDTLVLNQPATTVTIRARVSGEAKIKFASVALTDPNAPNSELEPNRRPWGRTLPVPQLAQMNYPNGNVICSPTALTMVMNFWADKLGRDDLRSDVPTTCAGVYDPGWEGTGNWSFNAAFAGSKPGFRAYVARLSALPELEDWIAHGWPVVTSVSYAKLKGEESQRPNDGHLVVLVGFTPDGDPIFNDPGRNVVRMTYKRADFERAWAHSARTCYLVYPRQMVPPRSRTGLWLDRFDPEAAPR